MSAEMNQRRREMLAELRAKPREMCAFPGCMEPMFYEVMLPLFCESHIDEFANSVAYAQTCEDAIMWAVREFMENPELRKRSEPPTRPEESP